MRSIVPLLALAAGASCAMGQGTLMPIGPFGSTFSGAAATRGFWFTAPVDFVVTGLRVPNEFGEAVQNVELVRFNSGPPPTFSTTTNDFVSLARHTNVAASEIIAVNIPVFAGETIGILGACGTTTMRNSYGPAGSGSFVSDIFGSPVTLTRMGMQFNLNSVAANALWQEPTGTFCRVEMYYDTGGPTGACCRTDGSCVITSGTACASAGGIYRGDNSVCATANCPQPATGACCMPSSCSVLTAAQCLTQNGTYRGDNTTCATANCPITEYVEIGDAGDLPSTAAIAAGTGGLRTIRGSLTLNDADMFQINICSPGSFEATTVGGTTLDTQLFLFDANGVGITHDDDDPVTGVLQSRLSSTFTAALPVGNYYLAISAYDMDPVDANNALLWVNTPFNVERAPDGPGAANPIRAWLPSGSAGAYVITLLGSCFVSTGPACYPNCDGSSVPPILNVSDFICFQTKYAAGDPYANCDGSTTPPVLNVSDFICFQTKYAAGCS